MKTHIIPRSISFGVFAITLSATAHAATLVEYKFTDDATLDRENATTVDSNVTASDWVLAPTGSGWGGTSTNFSINTTANDPVDADSGSIFARGDADFGNDLDPTTANDFMGFTLTVGTLGAGETLNITGFDYSIFSTTSAGTFAYEVGLYSDLTGFTGTGDMISDSNPRTNNDVNIASDVLSDETALQGLTSGTIVNFRLYFAHSTDDINDIMRLDNIAITGAVIPEPNTYALLVGLTGLSFVMLRRRRR